MSRHMASMSSRLALRTTVFTWVVRPISWASRRMRRPCAKLPFTRRNSSWMVAFEPSRLTASRLRPASLSAWSCSREASDVVAGVMAMRSPMSAPCRTRSMMSGRLKASPPEKTNTTRPNLRTSSRSFIPSAVVSSFGFRNGCAEARQWRQARSQAWVVSQITMNGARSKSRFGRAPKGFPCG